MIIYDRAANKILKRQEWTDEEALDEFLLTHPEILSLILSDNENSVVPLAGISIGGQLSVDADGHRRSIDGLFLHEDEEARPRLVLCEDKKGSNQELRSRAAMSRAVLKLGDG